MSISNPKIKALNPQHAMKAPVETRNPEHATLPIMTNGLISLKGFLAVKRSLHSTQNLIHRVKVAFKNRLAVWRKNHQQGDGQTANRLKFGFSGGVVARDVDFHRNDIFLCQKIDNPLIMQNTFLENLAV
jgi:hypothetical protein